MSACANIKTRGRHAFTLIELLCVMALIAVFGIVMTMMLLKIFDIERMQAAAFTRMLETHALTDQFRADVGRADNTLPEWQDYTANEQTLILQMKDGRVIYRWEEDRLLRRAFENGVFTERTFPIADRQIRAEFVEPRAGLKIVRLRLHRLQDSEPLAGRSLEIAAALGGDWR